MDHKLDQDQYYAVLEAILAGDMISSANLVTIKLGEQSIAIHLEQPNPGASVAAPKPAYLAKQWRPTEAAIKAFKDGDDSLFLKEQQASAQPANKPTWTQEELTALAQSNRRTIKEITVATPEPSK